MIKHPVTGIRISPRKFAKYVVRETLIELIFKDGWWDRFPGTHLRMKDLESDKVEDQMKKLFRSMDRRHRLEEDGRNGEKRVIRKRTRWMK